MLSQVLEDLQVAVGGCQVERCAFLGIGSCSCVIFFAVVQIKLGIGNYALLHRNCFLQYYLCLLFRSNLTWSHYRLFLVVVQVKIDSHLKILSIEVRLLWEQLLQQVPVATHCDVVQGGQPVFWTT